MARPGKARVLLVLALAAGLSYPLGWGQTLPVPVEMLWKGAAVTLLASWVAAQARGADGVLLALALAFGALGDILLVVSIAGGAMAFMVGHALAIWLYLRNRRAEVSPSQTLLALLVVPLAVLIAFLLPADRSQAPGVAVYGLFVGSMAATAWVSRFPRYRTGIGAMLFLGSDLLIFARMGPLAHGGIALGLVVWLTYLAGQTLIAVGGVEGIPRPRTA